MVIQGLTFREQGIHTMPKSYKRMERNICANLELDTMSLMNYHDIDIFCGVLNIGA